MKKEKIYIVQESIDWHNDDCEVEVHAYREQEKAQKKLLDLYTAFKKWCEKNERGIAYERNGASGTFIETSAEDYYNIWIKEIVLE